MKKLFAIIATLLILTACAVPIDFAGIAKVGGTEYAYSGQVVVEMLTSTPEPATETPEPTATETATATYTPLPPSPTLTATVTPSETGGYFIADQVPTGDLEQVAALGVNTVIYLFKPAEPERYWRGYMEAAKDAGINVVVYPSAPMRGACYMPYPEGYPDGNINLLKPMIDVLAEYDNWIGIINAHEPYWSCLMTEQEMTGLKNQLKAYAASKGRNIKIWNYIGHIADGNQPTLDDAELDQIADVFITWQHCAGDAEGTCEQAMNNLRNDRARIDRAGASVELVWLAQTFKIDGSQYDTKFTYGELTSLSRQAIDVGLDGFGFYTWDAWYSSDLHNWAELWPAVPEIYTYWADDNRPTPTPRPTSTPTPEGIPMSILIDYDFEIGNLSECASTSGTGLSAAAAAALAGTNYGLAVEITDTSNRYIEANPGADDTSGVVSTRIYFDPNGLTMGSGNRFVLGLWRKSSGQTLAQLEIEWSGSAYEPRLSISNDSGGLTAQYGAVMNDAPHYIEVRLTRATNNTSSDGKIEWQIDGSDQTSVTGIDNYDRFSEFRSLLLGAVSGLDAGTSGTFYLDELIINNDGGLIGPVVIGQPMNLRGINVLGLRQWQPARSPGF